MPAHAEWASRMGIDVKKLVFIGGTMGVGKTTVAHILKTRIPHCVLLEGDRCWDMNPFVVNDSTKKMVTDNIVYLINSFFSCNEIDTVIFEWVLHEQAITDGLLQRIDSAKYRFYAFSLICTPGTLAARLENDIACGLRKPDIIECSVARLPLYEELAAEKIHTDGISPSQVAEIIEERLNGGLL